MQKCKCERHRFGWQVAASGGRWRGFGSDIDSALCDRRSHPLSPSTRCGRDGVATAVSAQKGSGTCERYQRLAVSGWEHNQGRGGADRVRHIIAARDEARPHCAGGRVADASLPSEVKGDDDTEDYDADQDKTAATIVTLLRRLRRVMGTDIPGELHLAALTLGRVLRLGFRLGLRLWLRIGLGRRRFRAHAEPIAFRLLVLGRDFAHGLSGVSDERRREGERQHQLTG